MSNVIDFLARVGADASLRNASAETLSDALSTSSVDATLSQSILAGDAQALRERLSVPVFFGIQTKEDEENENEENEKKDKKEKKDAAVAGTRRRA